MKPAPDKFVADTTDDSDESELQLLICDGLAPLQFPAAERTALRDRLLRRVGESVRRHAGLLTVRSGDGVWRTVKAGIRARILWNGGQGSSALVEFAAGATLPAHRHRHLEEGIVLHGSLRLGDLELGPGDYHVSPPGSRHAPISSGTGGLAYLRGSSLGHTGAVLGELLGALVPGVGPAMRTVFSGEGNWEAIAPGVEQKILWQDGEVISRFLRLAAGASLPGHGHQQHPDGRTEQLNCQIRRCRQQLDLPHTAVFQVKIGPIGIQFTQVASTQQHGKSEDEAQHNRHDHSAA